MFFFCVFVFVLIVGEFSAGYAVDYFQKIKEPGEPSNVGPVANISQNFLVACGVVLGGILFAYLVGSEMFEFQSGSMTMICFTVIVGAIGNVIRVSVDTSTAAPTKEVEWNHRIKLMIVAAVARKMAIGISVVFLFGMVFLFAVCLGSI